MTFTQKQIDQLQAPLDRANVKSRVQGGSTVSYVEAYHAENEANRIFGFHAWNRETTIEHIGEREHEGKWRVYYRAKVRITVRHEGGVTVREGCGFGSGIDRDVGQAHESALKEAESDAEKRALKTFGNPFGQALYDKTQANVAEQPKATPPADDALVTDKQRNWLAGKIDVSQVPVGTVCERYGVMSLKEMTFAQAKEAAEWLKTQRKAA